LDKIWTMRVKGDKNIELGNLRKIIINSRYAPSFSATLLICLLKTPDYNW